MKSSQNIVRIHSLKHEGLSPYLTLRRPKEHWDRGIFVAEGEKVVIRLLSSNLPVISMLLTPEWYEKLLSRTQSADLRHVTIYVAEKELLETIVGFNLHQGIMAVAAIPPSRPLDEILSACRSPFMLVALDGLVNAENIGVVVRNASAFGIDALIAGERSGSPFLRRAVRNSMGAVFSLPVVHAVSLASTLTMVRDHHGTRILAAAPSGDLTIGEADFSGNICIVLGNEGEGVSGDIAHLADACVSIPMMNDTDSLNVANACAVILYEARRRRGLR